MTIMSDEDFLREIERRMADDPTVFDEEMVASLGISPRALKGRGWAYNADYQFWEMPEKEDA